MLKPKRFIPKLVAATLALTGAACTDDTSSGTGGDSGAGGAGAPAGQEVPARVRALGVQVGSLASAASAGPRELEEHRMTCRRLSLRTARA